MRWYPLIFLVLASLAGFSQIFTNEGKHSIAISLPGLVTYVYPKLFEDEQPGELERMRQFKISYYQTLREKIDLRISYLHVNNYSSYSNGKNHGSYRQNHRRIEAIQGGLSRSFFDDLVISPFVDIGIEVAYYSWLQDWYTRENEGQWGVGSYQLVYHTKINSYMAMGPNIQIGFDFKPTSYLYLSSSVFLRTWVRVALRDASKSAKIPYFDFMNSLLQIGFIF